MLIIGLALIAVGIRIAYSGYVAAWQQNHYLELWQRGIEAKEYNYHILFRATWWIPVGIGLLIVVFS